MVCIAFRNCVQLLPALARLAVATGPTEGLTSAQLRSVDGSVQAQTPSNNHIYINHIIYILFYIIYNTCLYYVNHNIVASRGGRSGVCEKMSV